LKLITVGGGMLFC